MGKLETLVKNADKLDAVDLFASVSPEEKELNRLTVECANLILRSRKAAGLSQKQLAAQLGVSQSAVSQWESGDANFSISTLAKVLAALNVRISITGRISEEALFDSAFAKPTKYALRGTDDKIIHVNFNCEERERM